MTPSRVYVTRLVAGGGRAVGRGGGLPHARHGQLQGTTEPRVGCLWESVSKKGQKKPRRDKKVTNRVRRSRRNTTVRGRGGEGGAPGTQVDIPHPAAHAAHMGVVDVSWRNCGPWRAHAGEVLFLMDGSPWGRPTPQQGESGRGMEQQKGTVL